MIPALKWLPFVLYIYDRADAVHIHKLLLIRAGLFLILVAKSCARSLDAAP